MCSKLQKMKCKLLLTCKVIITLTYSVKNYLAKHAHQILKKFVKYLLVIAYIIIFELSKWIQVQSKHANIFCQNFKEIVDVDVMLHHYEGIVKVWH